MESRSVRVSVLGTAGVGKSALTVRFMTGRFLHQYDPTLEDQYNKTLCVQGIFHDLIIADTAGQDRKHLQFYCSSSDVLLVAFSLADSTSLHQAKQLVGFINKIKKFSTILVGTKSDLHAERQISSEESLLAANDLGCPYVETSAASGINIEQVFQLAVSLAATRETSVIQPQSSFPVEKRTWRRWSWLGSIREILCKWKHIKIDRKLLESLQPINVSPSSRV